jgi:pyruvyltransferase
MTFANRNIFLRIIGAGLRFVNDIGWLFRKKIAIVAWCEYDGTRLMHHNWGDDINVLFFESISQRRFRIVNASYLLQLFRLKVYSCIGSVIGTTNILRVHIWGSGLISAEKTILRVPEKIFSVRGPLTREELLKRGIDCPERYGDPALLVSRYVRPSFVKRYRVGLIPHYTDIENPALKAFCAKHPEVLVIKMKNYRDWHEIPDQICSCEKIISSSLHGLIMADSYRVPNAWVSFSDCITGGDFKYLDYFRSVGRADNAAIRINTDKDIENILVNEWYSIARFDKINYRGILDVCPFKSELIDYNDLIPQLPQYISFVDKEQHYYCNEYIKTEAELDRMIQRLQPIEDALLFRGLNDARFKMFASSQRHWLQRTDWLARLGEQGYYDFIEKLIRRTEQLQEVMLYMQHQGVHNNDMYLLALMQHFGVPTPMIDFSENLMTGLFFATDMMEEWENSGRESLGDYVSLYYIAKGFDWVSATVQSMMKETELKLQAMLETYDQPYNAEETKKDIDHLLYRQFRLDNRNSDITFIPVGGPSLGRVTVNIPTLGLACDYEIINDRIVRQQGMFIMNNTEQEPLVEVMNKQSQQKMFCCVNIHKNLVKYIQNKLNDMGYTHDTVYQNHLSDVQMLTNAMMKLG